MADTKKEPRQAVERYANIKAAYPVQSKSGKKGIGLIINGTVQDGKGNFEGPLIDHVDSNGKAQHAVILSMEKTSENGPSPFERFAKSVGVNGNTVNAIGKHFDEKLKGETPESRRFDKLEEVGFKIKMNGKGTNLIYSDEKGKAVNNMIKTKDGKYEPNPKAVRVSMVNLDNIERDKDFDRSKEDAEVTKRLEERKAAKEMIDKAANKPEKATAEKAPETKEVSPAD